MSDFYSDYPLYIQKELKKLGMNRYNIKTPKKKSSKCLRKLKLTVTRLRNKASK